MDNFRANRNLIIAGREPESALAHQSQHNVIQIYMILESYRNKNDINGRSDNIATSPKKIEQYTPPYMPLTAPS